MGLKQYDVEILHLRPCDMWVSEYVCMCVCVLYVCLDNFLILYSHANKVYLILNLKVLIWNNMSFEENTIIK